MNKTEIAKALYKQKPDAIFRLIMDGNAHYFADLAEERITFIVPVDDMGSAVFTQTMEAKHMIRWVIES